MNSTVILKEKLDYIDDVSSESDSEMARQSRTKFREERDDLQKSRKKQEER